MKKFSNESVAKEFSHLQNKAHEQKGDKSYEKCSSDIQIQLRDSCIATCSICSMFCVKAIEEKLSLTCELIKL